MSDEHDKRRRKLDRLVWQERVLWPAIIIAATMMIGGSAIFFMSKSSQSHVHDGYTRATVNFTTSAGDEFNLSVFASLPDKTQINASTNSLVLSNEVTDTVCLERRLRERGRNLYRIVAQRNCDSE
ncbi:MAG: hypothetical protein AAGK67_09405 [Pseudomonadota bacterium]